jgi:type I restriction enzyme, S subunit
MPTVRKIANPKTSTKDEGRRTRNAPVEISEVKTEKYAPIANHHDLPQGWEWATIGEITETIDKVDPSIWPDKEFIYLDISSIDNTVYRVVEPKSYLGQEAPSRARQLVQGSDVLFSTVRTYLKNIALVPDAYDGQIASTGFSVLRGRAGISSRYLFHFCLTDEFLTAMAELQRGTSYPAVRDSDVREHLIPLPPLAEQHRIVAAIEQQLTRLDAGVASLRAAQARLRHYKAAVLKARLRGSPCSPGPRRRASECAAAPHPRRAAE